MCVLKTVGNVTPTNDKNCMELDLLSDLVAAYEDANEAVLTPSFV